MKHSAWVIALVLGGTGCSGSIGGDLTGHAGQAGSGGGTLSPSGGDAGWSNLIGGAGVGGSDATAGSGGTGGYRAAAGSGSVQSGGRGGNGEDSAGGFPTGGTGEAGSVATAGQGGSLTTEPTPTCSSTVDAWIAFDAFAPDLNRDLYVVRPDGSQLTRLTADPSVEKEPFFAPTGNRLSFTSDRDGSAQIYVMDLTTLAVTQVTHRPEGAGQSSFSPDGQLLAFHSGISVYIIGLDGSNETLIATGLNELNAYSNPRFIGNTQLVFDRNNEIDAIGLDQTEFHNIVEPASAMIVAPSVSPANNDVAYAAECFGEPGLSIWTVPTNVVSKLCSGGRVTPLNDPQDNSRPSWGPAGTFAYQRVNPTTNIGRITLNTRTAGSMPCSLTPADQDSRNPNWSAVGQQLSVPIQ